jgi:hypothetical protein
MILGQWNRLIAKAQYHHHLWPQGHLKLNQLHIGQINSDSASAILGNSVIS